jgi:uncharacterized protein
LLVLERHNASTPIKPSFACTKAQNTIEKAICTSATLAGYDRSVAAAYRRALSLAGDESADVRRESRSIGSRAETPAAAMSRAWPGACASALTN